MFFSDDFDNGQRNSANGFVWAGIPTQTNPRISNEMAFSGTHSMRFQFNATAFGGQAWSEERFDMGRYLSELAFEYMLYVPANFKHRDAPLNSAGTNNKFFSLWRDQYGGDKGSWEISVGWVRTNDLESYALFHSTRSIHNWIAPFDQRDKFIGSNTPMKPGQWNRIRFYVKASTYRGTLPTGDGIMKMWINNTLFFSTTTGNFNNFDPSLVGTTLRLGYLMGYANSGFDETTVFFIDAIKFFSGNPGW
ncbi:heparin lyase I family protein [Gemmatimonas sp.]|uniref:heparin lyase I family protein n=1 Tax=Gemmatimonas sp. TaxID=1962908 RepID=UPI003DA284AC